MTKTKQKGYTDWRIVATGMICLTIAELFALWLGYNGTMFAAYVGIMALAIGVVVENPLKK